LAACLNLLDELEPLGIVTLPMKIEQKNKGYQKEIQWTENTNAGDALYCTIAELMPISLQIVTDKENAEQWNEFVDRYHYLGYRRPRGSYLRYYINDRHGRKLGCLLNLTIPDSVIALNYTNGGLIVRARSHKHTGSPLSQKVGSHFTVKKTKKSDSKVAF